MWAIESISQSSGRMINKESGLKSIYFYVCRYCFTFIFKSSFRYYWFLQI